MMLPKATVDGLAVSCATGAGDPVPLNARLVGESDALLTNETLPPIDPFAEGAKFSEKEVVAPAASVIGRVSPVAL